VPALRVDTTVSQLHYPTKMFDQQCQLANRAAAPNAATVRLPMV